MNNEAQWLEKTRFVSMWNDLIEEKNRDIHRSKKFFDWRLEIFNCLTAENTVNTSLACITKIAMTGQMSI